ncbi:MAG: glycosyltransferase [Acidobacteriota bacterium]
MPSIPSLNERLREALRPFYLRHIYFPLRPSCRPPEFTRCWEVPHEFQDGPNCLTIPSPHPPLPDVLFLPMTDWHHRLQRSQRLALALARLGRRCFLLNPHLGREYPVAPWRRRPAALARLDDSIFEIHAPLPNEPVFHHRLLTPAESRAVADAVHWALQRAGVQSLDIVFALPTWKDCALDLRRRWQAVLAYDCHDWLAGFPNMARQIAAAERDSLEAADIRLFSASSLMASFGPVLPDPQSRSILLRNGVPDWPPAPTSRPAEPVVGYLGALEDWFWTDAVAEAARTLPGVRFLLAGAAAAPLRRALSGLRNVEFAGEIPPERVPALLRQFRIGLIPFQGPLAPFTDPLKVYEYFHHGLPVVASPLPELDRFGGLVLQAATPAGFAQAVREALEEDDRRLEEARRAEARAATWTRRAEALNQILLEARQRPGGVPRPQGGP